MLSNPQISFWIPEASAKIFFIRNHKLYKNTFVHLDALSLR